MGFCNKVGADVPLRPVVEVLEQCAVVLVALDVLDGKRDVREIEENLSGKGEEVEVRLLVREWLGTKDLGERPFGVARDGSTTRRDAVEAIDKVSEPEHP